MKSILIAAPKSGSGKTCITLGLLSALRKRGLEIAPFKVGPDYIDPGLHSRACGIPSRNLDGWLCGADGVQDSFARGIQGVEGNGVDIAVIEGVMGLFDGASGSAESGSSAEIAKLTGSQVLLVVDASSQARSVAALIKGFVDFDSGLRFAGVILNRVASDNHESLLREAVESTAGLPPVLGVVRRSDEMILPSRHLGLVTADDQKNFFEWMNGATAKIEETIDIDSLLASLSEITDSARELPKGAEPKVKIAVARDKAFNFYYRENLELLAEAGAMLIPFSPLRHQELPEDIDGIYLGGGYPELYAKELSANRCMCEAIKAAAEACLPIYAECGGFLYLNRAMDGTELCDILPGESKLQEKRAALGYRQIELTGETILGPRGTIVKGHEFHYSTTEMPASVENCYRTVDRKGESLEAAGYRHKNVLASYVHLHFGSNPQVAKSMVEFCRKVRDGEGSSDSLLEKGKRLLSSLMKS